MAVLTVNEMRLHLQDTCAEDNELLGELEYSDKDIMNAMMSAVDFANGAMAGSGLAGNFTVANFPNRYFLKQGTGAYLMRSRAVALLRDTLPYNAGGISIDDKDKSRQYMEMAQPMKEEFNMYVGRLHHAANFQIGRASCRERV